MGDTGPKGADPDGMSSLCNQSCFVVITVLVGSFMFHMLIIIIVGYATNITESDGYLNWRIRLTDRFRNTVKRIKQLNIEASRECDDEDNIRFRFRGQKYVLPEPGNAIVESILRAGHPLDHSRALRWEDVEFKLGRMSSATRERCAIFDRPLFPGECVVFTLDGMHRTLVFGLVGSCQPHFSVPGRNRCSMGICPSKLSVLIPGLSWVKFGSHCSSSSMSKVVICYPEGFVRDDVLHRPLVIHVFVGGTVHPNTDTGRNLVRSNRDFSNVAYGKVASFHVFQDLFPASDFESVMDTREIPIPALYPAVGMLDKELVCKFNMSVGPISEPFLAALEQDVSVV
eukprot:ANDGO_07848.mRNA.1 hypothetical protein